MTTTYTIIFTNERATEGTYAVFTAPPNLDNTAKVFSNVWMSQYVAPKATFTISSGVQYYAWVGTTPGVPRQGTSVTTANMFPAVLGTETQGGTSFPMKVKSGVNYLDQAQVTLTAEAGAFAIETGFDFEVPNTKYLIGMGKPTPAGTVVPCATILADNNTTTNISPIVTFYIAKSSYTPGTVVNFSEASRQAAKIDFSSPEASGFFTATVQHMANGEFKVKFQSESATALVFAKRAERQKQLELTGAVSGEKLTKLQSQFRELNTLLQNFGIRSGVGLTGEKQTEPIDNTEQLPHRLIIPQVGVSAEDLDEISE